MNYVRPLGPKDEQSKPDYDLGFIGLDERIPMQLNSGYVNRAGNKRFRNGVCSTRLGVQICPWMLGDGRTPWNEVYCATVYSQPPDLTQTVNSLGQPVFGETAKVQWFLIAADGGVWKTRPGMTASPVALPAGITLTPASATMFVQCFNVVILLRGPNAAPLVMPDLDSGFQQIVQTPADIAAGLSPIPNASYGLSYLNRLLLIEGADLLAVSDVQDYANYLPLQDTFRINQGDTDTLVSLFPFGPQQVLALKNESIIPLTNFTGDLSSLAQGEASREYGCGAPLSVTATGTDIFWLSEEGRIRTMTLTQLNQSQTTDEALTDPLIPYTLPRLNGLYLSGCVAEIWDSKLYMAVPLDDATFTGPNLLAQQNWVEYHGGSFNLAPLLVNGLTYAWTPGTTGGFGQLVWDGQTYTAPLTFIYDGTAILLEEAGYGAAISDTLQQVIIGVNTGVLVYDFLNDAWCGADEAPGVFCVKAFLKLVYNGKKRLFFIGADGVIRLYEEGYEDEVLALVPTGYVDVLVNTLPNPGDTVAASGSAFITAANATANTGTTWGCDTLADAQANLYAGFLNTWARDGRNVLSQIDWGIRLTGFTGTAPVVTVGGTWAFVDAHSGFEVTSQPIVDSVTTRGYISKTLWIAEPDKKRYLAEVFLIQTWAPNYTAGVQVAGVSAETDYNANITRDNTQYDVQGEPPWNNTNANDDHATPKRQDYSVILPDLGLNLGNNGVAFDLLQFATERVPVNEFGHFLQGILKNQAGRIELWGTVLETQQGERLSGTTVA